MNNGLFKTSDETLDTSYVVRTWTAIGYTEIDTGGLGYVVCCTWNCMFDALNGDVFDSCK